MTTNGEDRSIPAFLLRADSEANNAMSDLGIVKLEVGTKKQIRQLETRVADAAQHISLFIGREVTIAGKSHYIFASPELDYDEQDTIVEEGVVGGTFQGLVLTDCLPDADNTDVISRVAIRLDTTLVAENEDGEVVLEQPAKALTRIGDITSFTFGFEDEELN